MSVKCQRRQNLPGNGIISTGLENPPSPAWATANLHVCAVVSTALRGLSHYLVVTQGLGMFCLYNITGRRYHIWLSLWLSGKECISCNAGDIGNMSSIPLSGRSPGGGHGNPLQYSCLENPIERGA